MTMSENAALKHYSSRALTIVEAMEQNQEPRNKPKGLWVSVEGEDDWPQWCKEEEFGLSHLKIEHDIFLTEDANIIHLRSVAHIDEFHATYGEKSGPEWYRSVYINWAHVAEEYQGIIISPYQWERRLNGGAQDWYYSWDCASGCIWDPATIRGIKAVEMAA